MNSNLIQSDSEPHWRYTEVALNPMTHSIFAAVPIYLFSCCSMEGPKGDPHSGHTSSTFHFYINMCILESNPRSTTAVAIYKADRLKVEHWCVTYLSSLCKTNRARCLLVTIISMTTMLMEMIVTMPTASTPATAATLLLSEDRLATNTKGNRDNHQVKATVHLHR